MWLNNAEALISGIVSVGATIGVEKMPCVSLSSGVSVFQTTENETGYGSECDLIHHFGSLWLTQS